MRNREMLLVDVNKVFDEYGEEGIKLDIPRTNDSETGMPSRTLNTMPNKESQLMNTILFLSSSFLECDHSCQSQTFAYDAL